MSVFCLIKCREKFIIKGGECKALPQNKQKIKFLEDL